MLLDDVSSGLWEEDDAVLASSDMSRPLIITNESPRKSVFKKLRRHAGAEVKNRGAGTRLKMRDGVVRGNSFSGSFSSQRVVVKINPVQNRTKGVGVGAGSRAKNLYQPALCPDEQARLEVLLREGSDLVGPFLTRRDLGYFERRRVKKGIAKLTAVLAAVPDAWNACWMLGMSYRGLGDHTRALELLRRAYVIDSHQIDVGREYAGQCFFAGAAEEGVRVSRELHARFPADVGLHSNLALALLIGGDLAEAAAVAAAALAREPADAITRALVDFIADVRAGRRPRPARMPGM